MPALRPIPDIDRLMSQPIADWPVIGDKQCGGLFQSRVLNNMLEKTGGSRAFMPVALNMG